jgi:hypothetical protein
VTTSGKTDPAPAKAPTIVNVAFWLAIAGLTIIVLLAVLIVAIKNQSIALALENQAKLPADQRIDPDSVRRAINLGVWLNFGSALLFGLLAAFFMRKVRQGDRKSRFRFAIAAAALILMMVLIQGLNIALIPLAAVLAILTSIGLVFSGTATRFLNDQ